MKVLVTGGAGYIGSHTVVELLEAGHEVVVVDNFANSSPVALERVREITGKDVVFYELDLRDSVSLGQVLDEHAVDAAIHFAGLKAVGESVAEPLRYYRTNIDSTLTLLEQLAAHDVYRLVFSSSATVYGDPARLPITEDMPRSATNPYGQTKLMIEQILSDVAHADARWDITSLRYFNPVGAHPSGRIGEDPDGIPNNLLPYVSQVAVGRRDKISVHGDDYDTPDGTGVRDYIHVVDLALAHLAALQHEGAGIYKAYNIGTGQGVSVLEIIQAFSEACGKELPYEIGPRRPGDIASCYADPSLAERELGWHATRTIAEACADGWRWQQDNPQGYAAA